MLFTNTENPEVLPQLVRNPEVLTKVTCTTRPELVEDTLGKSTTPCLCGDTDIKFDFNCEVLFALYCSIICILSIVSA